MTDKALLIDGLNYLHRGCITFKPKQQSIGWSSDNRSDQPEVKEDFTVVYNFFRNLRATIEQFTPTKVFFCLEGKNSFRKALFPDYKANRITKTGSLKSKDDFLRQFDIAIELLHYLPLTQVVADTFEADDVINTLCHNLKDEETVVISNDGDLTQILQSGLAKVGIYNYNRKAFVQSPDYHFLTFKCFGDKSDNITRLASESKAIAYASNPKKLLEFLASEENRANYSLNKQLVELRIIPNEQLQFIDFDVNYERLKTEFEKMEFKSMIEPKYWERFVRTFLPLGPKN